MPGKEGVGRLTKEETNRVSFDRTAGFVFSVGKKVIRSYLRREHLNRWKARNVYRHSKTLMRKPLPSTAYEPLAMSRPTLKVAVGLLTGRTTLKARIFQLGIPQRLCGDEREDSVHIVCHCRALTCKRYRNLDCMFLKPKNIQNVRMNSPVI